MNAPVLEARLTLLEERRERLDEELTRRDGEIAELRQLLGLKPAKKRRRSRSDIPACGTEQGYQRHAYRKKRHGEPMPDDCGCREAHNKHNREGG